MGNDNLCMVGVEVDIKLWMNQPDGSYSWIPAIL